jgi:hypothetical protein
MKSNNLMSEATGAFEVCRASGKPQTTGMAAFLAKA